MSQSERWRAPSTSERPYEAKNTKAVEVVDWTVDMENELLDLPAKHDKHSKLHNSKGVRLRFEDVSYRVNLKPQTTWWDVKSWKRKISHQGKEMVILRDIYGLVEPGDMLAMMGPSGSGKTTLLNLLGGRVKGDISGIIRYNDSPFNKRMKRRTGYVSQEDVLFAHLTVRETLVFAALLRLPREISEEEKIQRADEVITQLGLEKCKNTMIGGPFLRGVSGGERKRVSIGHEMLIDPSLLLLDEPTSGLDSTIALKITQTLQELAKGGRTVITTIHQPSSIIFHLFDKLLLLSEGRTIYFGARAHAMKYFASLGLSPSFETNPADFLLDLANGVKYIVDPSNEHSTGELSLRPDLFKRTASSADFRRILRDSYTSILLPRVKSSLMRVARETSDEVFEGGTQNSSMWSTTWYQQFSILLVRSVKERRHEVFSGLRIFQVLFMSIISGLLWWQSSVDNVQDQAGLMFFLTTFWGFFPLFSSIFTFPNERGIVMKERASGMYHLTAYFFGRTTGDLPLELVLPTLSLTTVYWMSGLKATPGAYFGSLFSLLLTVIVAQGLGLAIGAAVMNLHKATVLGSVTMLTFQLVAGFFLQDVPGFIDWLKYLSFPYYAFRLQLSCQYHESQTYKCGPETCVVREYPLVKEAGLGGVAVDVPAMLAMVIGYRFLAYVALSLI